LPRYIVKINPTTDPDGDRYLEWSTVVDAPVTYGMTLDEFKDYYRSEYGADGMRRLPERLERVEKKGLSAIDYSNLNELLVANRAGPNETYLTTKEIYTAYCLNKPIREGWTPEES